jgi:hypothetical protein
MVWAVMSIVGLVVETSVIVALGLSATGGDTEPAVTGPGGAPGAGGAGRGPPGGC